MFDKKANDCIQALNCCTNRDNVGNRCWEKCVYRENGCCELDTSEIITTLLKSVIGKDITYNENFIWTLKEMIENKNDNSPYLFHNGFMRYIHSFFLS